MTLHALVQEYATNKKTARTAAKFYLFAETVLLSCFNIDAGVAIWYRRAQFSHRILRR